MTAEELIERVRELISFTGSVPNHRVIEKIEEALDIYDHHQKVTPIQEKTQNEKQVAFAGL